MASKSKWESDISATAVTLLNFQHWDPIQLIKGLYGQLISTISIAGYIGCAPGRQNKPIAGFLVVQNQKWVEKLLGHAVGSCHCVHPQSIAFPMVQSSRFYRLKFLCY